MITLFVIGILILSIKFIVLACKGNGKSIIIYYRAASDFNWIADSRIHIIGSPSFNYNTDSSIYLEFCETILKRS